MRVLPPASPSDCDCAPAQGRDAAEALTGQGQARGKHSVHAWELESLFGPAAKFPVSQ